MNLTRTSRVAVLTLITLFLGGCTSLPERKQTMVSGGVRVGYLIRAATYPTHWHKQSYAHPYRELHWDLTTPLKETFDKVFTGYGDIATQDLEQLGYKSEDLYGLIQLREGQFIVPDLRSKTIENLKENHKLDYVVLIYPYEFSEVTHCTPYGCFGSINGIGTGFSTEGLFGSYAFSIIQGLEYTVYDLNELTIPSAYAPTTRPNEGYRIADLQTPKKWRQMTNEELRPVYEHLLRVNENLSRRILSNILGEDIKCRGTKLPPKGSSFTFGSDNICAKSK